MTATLDRDRTAPDSVAPRGRLLWWLRVLVATWLVFGTWLLLTASPPTLGFEVSTAVAHGALVFFVAITIWGLVAGRATSALISAAAGVIGFVVLTEVAQTWLTDERTGSVADVGSNAIGLAVAVVAAVALRMGAPSLVVAKRLVAIFSTTAMVAVGLAIGAADPRVDSWWQCRDASLPESGVPTVRIEGTTTGSEAPHDLAGRLACQVHSADEFTAIVSFTSDTLSQEGPTRILTWSAGPDENQVNFHVGQSGSNLSVRVRSGGLADREWYLVDNVIRPNVEHRVAVRVEAGTVDIWLDGELLESHELPHSDLDGWNRDYPIVLGDEADGGRVFVGEIGVVELYAEAVDDVVLASG